MNKQKYTIKQAQGITGLSRHRILQAIKAYKIGEKVKAYGIVFWLLTKKEISLIIERKGESGKRLPEKFKRKLKIKQE